MAVSEATYLRLMLEDPDTKWELHCGQLWSKPLMTFEHSQVSWVLGFRLQNQLGLERYIVRVEVGHVRRSESRYYIPDVIVAPREMWQRLFSRPGIAEIFPEPLPLVVEVWSPSTGRLDIEEKLPEYQRRGDLEIWRIHSYDRVLTAWVRQPDGSYTETVYRQGSVRPAFLPDVSINLDELFSS
jgi:Uma2 family endonuclease